MRNFLVLLVLFTTTCWTAATAQQTRSELYGPQQFWEQFSAEDTAFVIDLRTPEEFAKGHIEGAININYYHNTFDQWVDTLNREIPMYVYGSKGHRSYKAARVFADKKFKEVYDLSGGFSRWEAESMPVVK